MSFGLGRLGSGFGRMGAASKSTAANPHPGDNLLLTGDMQSGTDILLLTGDMQSGTDALLLSGTP